MHSALIRGFKVYERLDRNSPLMTSVAMCIYLQRQKKDRDGQESKQNEATENMLPHQYRSNNHRTRRDNEYLAVQSQNKDTPLAPIKLHKTFINWNKGGKGSSQLMLFSVYLIKALTVLLNAPNDSFLKLKDYCTDKKQKKKHM